MTTISTVEDIIGALDSDPALLEAIRARLLTRDVLDLPKTVARIVASQETVNEQLARIAASQETMAEQMARISTSHESLQERVERLEASHERLQASHERLAASHERLAEKVAVLAERVDVLAEKLAALTERVDVLTQRVDMLTEKLAALTERVDMLTEQVAVLTEKVAILTEDVAVLKVDVAVLKGDVAVLKDDVAVLKGDHLEMRLQSRVHAMLGQRKRLRGIRIVSAAFPAGMNPGFADAIDDATDDGRITEDQRGRIMSTDLIATARRQFSQGTIYVSFEAAYSLDEDDARRVAETGDALLRVFPQAEVMTFVYGHSISERDRAIAEAGGVEVVLERAAR